MVTQRHIDVWPLITMTLLSLESFKICKEILSCIVRYSHFFDSPLYLTVFSIGYIYGRVNRNVLLNQHFFISVLIFESIQESFYF